MPAVWQVVDLRIVILAWRRIGIAVALWHGHFFHDGSVTVRMSVTVTAVVRVLGGAMVMTVLASHRRGRRIEVDMWHRAAPAVASGGVAVARQQLRRQQLHR